MSKIISLTATKRDSLGTAASRRLRKQGFIPAVIYSAGAETISIQLSEEQVASIEHHTGLVSIALDGAAPKNAIVKEVSYKAINSSPLSVDFLEVKAGEKVTVVVPIEAQGEPEGIRQGGQLEQVLHEISIEVAPADIPEVLVVDVSALKVDEFLTAAQIALPASAVLKNKADEIAFQVRIPHTKALEEAEPAAADAAAPADAAPAEKK